MQDIIPRWKTIFNPKSSGKSILIPEVSIKKGNFPR